jgi:hypothetical protein
VLRHLPEGCLGLGGAACGVPGMFDDEPSACGGPCVVAGEHAVRLHRQHVTRGLWSVRPGLGAAGRCAAVAIALLSGPPPAEQPS